MDFNKLSSNSTILGNLFYDTYKNAGPSAGLVTMAILIGLCAVPGNFMNLFLVYLTLKHKCLRGSSNYLLALNSFYEFLHQTGHYIFLFTILSGRNFIPHDKICGKTYLFIHTLLSCIPGVYLAARVFFYALDNPTEPVTGQLSDTCTPINLIYNYNMVVCIITFVLYVLLALIVWKKVPQQSENSRRLVRSLSAICGLIVGSYFFNTIIRLIVVDWLNPIQLWYVNVAGGDLVNIGAASNAPILFLISTPYRTLIKQEFRAVWPSRTVATKPPKPNQVAPFPRQKKTSFNMNTTVIINNGTMKPVPAK
uniref:Vomeronasal type-1 receptor n=1 Tax=Globodera rostochiensis TaxID=31243 RepID=A0A914IAZ5_GLORO